MRRAALVLPLMLVFAVVLDNIGVAGCGPEGQPSTVAWDGRAYTTAWAAPSTFNVTVWSAQFRPEDFGDGQVAVASFANRHPERVIKLPSVAAPPEIVAGDGDMMALVLSGEGDLFAVPLDGGGARKARGKEPIIATGVERLCVRPVFLGGSYWAAYATGDAIELAAIDRDGAVTRRDRFDVDRPIDCAMAAGDGRIAVAAASRSTRTSVQQRDRVALIQTPGASGPLRLARRPGGWAMLRQNGDRLEVLLHDDGDRDTRDPIPVPAPVDPKSVDMVRADAGLFLSWLDGRKIRWAFVGHDQVGEFATGRKPLGTRAVSHADVCALTWTADRGSRVWILRIGGCHP